MRAEFYREQHRGFHTEHDLLGDIKWKPILEKIQVPKDGYSKAEWMKISREQYPANRYNPPKKWGKDLLWFTADHLGVDLNEHPKALEMIITAGQENPLDKMGCDFFVCFKNPKTGREQCATCDITKQELKTGWKIDQNKPSEWNAKKPKSIIIDANEFPDPRENLDDYVEVMKKYSQILAETLKRKTEPIH